jgi:hypothetical protein
VLADRLNKKTNELELSKAEVAQISRRLMVVTEQCQTTNHSYQETASRIAECLKQLELEIDCHIGTKAQLARAAAKLIVARAKVVDPSMEVE